MTKKQAEFKKLQDKWYKKLEKSGFEDIEQADGNLKQWHSQYFITRHTTFEGKSSWNKKKKLDATWFTSQEEYYQLAGAFLHDHEFSSKTEKLIWEMHSNGMSQVDIYKALLKKGNKVYRDGIRNVVNTLAKIMVDKCQLKKT